MKASKSNSGACIIGMGYLFLSSGSLSFSSKLFYQK